MRPIAPALLRLRLSPRSLRLALVLSGAALVVLAVLAGLAKFPPPGRGGLADHRAFLGIPNALDVLSNLPFALVGWLGLRRSGCLATELRPCARLVFLAIAFAALGSSYYHLAPSPGRLLVDRLPITIAFMALFAWVLGDRIGPRWATRALAPLVALGLAALWTWRGSGAGDGDLRPYVLVQAVPLAWIAATVCDEEGLFSRDAHFEHVDGLRLVRTAEELRSLLG